MKKRALKLIISEPCHENWSAMSPNNQGRFCDSCAKSVVDFSGYSDSDILKFLVINKDQKTCGRFRASQLERPLIELQPYSAVSSSFSLRAVLFGATLSSLLAAEKAYGQETNSNTPTQIEQCTDTSEVEFIKMGEMVAFEYDHSDEKLISGVVYTVDSTALVNVKITLFNTVGEEVGKTFSLSDGSFRLDLDWSKEPVYFSVYSMRYEDQLHYLNTIEVLQEMNFYLEKKEEIILGMIAPVYVKDVEPESPMKKRKK